MIELNQELFIMCEMINLYLNVIETEYDTNPFNFSRP